MRKLRSKTEGAQHKHSSPHLQKKIDSLPSITKQEKQLLGESLSTCLLPPKQTEVLIENYVMGRRILKTKPIISRSKFERDFRDH